MLKLFIGKELAEVKVFKFPAGESGVSFSVERDYAQVMDNVSGMITLSWEGNDDLINLALLVDALRRKYTRGLELSLNIPYFPYARQDRVCNKGESLSVKVIADFINSIKFDSVYVYDPHSDVLGAVLDNMVVLDNKSKVMKAWHEIAVPEDNEMLVSPDAGALKKVYGYAQYCRGIGVVRADKTRSTYDGKITGTVVYSEHLGKTHLLVVDDICDGGGTFIPLAAELRKITTGTVNLFVTHGIFTKGVDIFEGVYDNIFVVNNMFGPHKLIKEI